MALWSRTGRRLARVGGQLHLLLTTTSCYLKVLFRHGKLVNGTSDLGGDLVNRGDGRFAGGQGKFLWRGLEMNVGIRIFWPNVPAIAGADS